MPPRRSQANKGESTMPVLTAYCTKLRKKVEMDQIELVTMKNGRPAAKGVAKEDPSLSRISDSEQGRGGRAGQGSFVTRASTRHPHELPPRDPGWPSPVAARFASREMTEYGNVPRFTRSSCSTVFCAGEPSAGELQISINSRRPLPSGCCIGRG